MAFRIALIGLGWIGSSIGLSLKRAGAKFELVGHDKDHDAARSAQKSGCVDRTEWNLISACDGADLVVISTPLAGIKSTLSALGRELKAGCVVTDTASLKVPVLEWAHEFLPSTVHFVGGHPIVERPRSTGSGPAADLFDGTIYCLTPTPTAPPEALQRASDLAEAVGAKPYYLEAAEHDGLIAAVEQLPLLSAMALQTIASESPSHREILRLSGADLTTATQGLAGEAEELAQVCTLNADNVSRWLDSLLAKLAALRASVAGRDGESLQKAFAQALEARERWARKHAAEGPEVDYGDFSMSRMMLGGAFRSRKPQGE